MGNDVLGAILRWLTFEGALLCEEPARPGDHASFQFAAYVPLAENHLLA